MGLIDYLRQYDIISVVEKNYKLIKNMGSTPTIIEPKDYKKRFLDYMLKKYIVTVEVSHKE